jgi:hypothetical protein
MAARQQSESADRIVYAVPFPNVLLSPTMTARPPIPAAAKISLADALCRLVSKPWGGISDVKSGSEETSAACYNLSSGRLAPI